MGINWSDLMHSDNPKRRDEVHRLAESIRSSVIQLYANVRTVSISLNQAYSGFQILPKLDLGISFKKSFNLIDQVMGQWKAVTEELLKDPTIPQKIKDLMDKFKNVVSVGQLPDVVKDVVDDPHFKGLASTGGLVVGLIAGTVASYLIHLGMKGLVEVTWATVAVGGVAGCLIGGGIGLLASIILGAIEGASERASLEDLKREYKRMDDNLGRHLSTLENDVASVQRAIIKALPDD